MEGSAGGLIRIRIPRIQNQVYSCDAMSTTSSLDFRVVY